MNKLLFGGNLGWLRNARIFPDASVDLVYLDPPFNSNANYNVLFKEKSGKHSHAQITAFEDTWEWGKNRKRRITRRSKRAARLPTSFRLFAPSLAQVT